MVKELVLTSSKNSDEDNILPALEELSIRGKISLRVEKVMIHNYPLGEHIRKWGNLSVISRPTLVSEHSRPQIQQASMEPTGEKWEKSVKASLGVKCGPAVGNSMGSLLFVVGNPGRKGGRMLYPMDHLPDTSLWLCNYIPNRTWVWGDGSLHLVSECLGA